MSVESEKVVSDFCKAWAGLNLDQIMGFFTDDAVYHNIPLKPASGKEEIRKTITGLLKGTTWLEFK
ncbi:MAG: nuclear transport factor 2 family protein, partial [Candidatus Binataceae bacterium]